MWSQRWNLLIIWYTLDSHFSPSAYCLEPYGQKKHGAITGPGIQKKPGLFLPGLYIYYSFIWELRIKRKRNMFYGYLHWHLLSCWFVGLGSITYRRPSKVFIHIQPKSIKWNWGFYWFGKDLVYYYKCFLIKTKDRI